MRTRRMMGFVAAIAMGFISIGVAAGDEEKTGAAKRKPAHVMGHEGAAWLERPERIKEERPDEVVAAMELKDGDVVADIGCGSGFFTWRLAKAVAPQGKVYGQDIQPEMLELLKQRCEHEKITNVEPVLGKEDDPLLPPKSSDWILLVDVYHEFQQPEIMLKKMRDALKDNGHVALVEYRLLGETAKHIKEEHRMSVKQVLAEWQPAGFELVDLLTFLPTQDIFIFKKRLDEKTR